MLSAEKFGTVIKFATVANPPPHPIQELCCSVPFEGQVNHDPRKGYVFTNVGRVALIFQQT